MTAAGHRLRPASSAPIFGRGWLLWSLGQIGVVLGAWGRRFRYRRELARLVHTSPHLVEDIGLLRKHADREMAKPFWRP